MTEDQIIHSEDSILINVDGSSTIVKPKNGKDFSLEEMNEFVGGYIEIPTLMKVGLPSKLLVVNEEGKLLEMPVNVVATKIWKKYFGSTDIIVGNVLICNTKMIK